MGILLLKLSLAPLLVVGSTLAGRRWGPEAAGILVALPIVAGPILFISYQQHGAGFAGVAARSSLLGLVALAVFTVVFARTARRFGWPVAVATSWIAVLATDFALSHVQVTLAGALGLTLAVTTIAMVLMPGIERSGPPEQPPPPRWDLPARAFATGALVLTVTTASSVLGPHWTGLLAPFPIAISVVSAFVHAQHGSTVATRTLSGALVGLFSFATFCVTVATLVQPLGSTAFLVGVAVTVAVQLLVMRVRNHGTARSSPG